MLKDDTTLEENNVSESGFMVVLVQKVRHDPVAIPGTPMKRLFVSTELKVQLCSNACMVDIFACGPLCGVYHATANSPFFHS